MSYFATPARGLSTMLTREQTTASSRQDRLTTSDADTMRAEQSARLRWLICRAGNVLCALHTEHVAEVMRLLPIEPVADAPTYVRGLCIIRGLPVPVVDAGLIVRGVRGAPTRLVAIRAGTRMVALAVDAAIGITDIVADEMAQLPPLLRDTASETVAAIGARDGELLVCLRSGRLVPEEVLARLYETGAAA